MSVILSTQMNLPIPVVGEDQGPDYASNINNCLTLIDSHDHSSGSGVQITPAGLNINSDLAFNTYNATGLRTARLNQNVAVLSDPSDIDCLYDVNGDLYFNDGSGNQIRITQGGAVAGTPGSIANLVSPASASYVSASQKFVFQSAANVAGSMDIRNLILRNSSALSNGLTLSPPAAMGSNYTIVLPSLPAAQSFVTLDASGNMGAPVAIAQGITASMLAADSVITAKILDLNVTTAKINTEAVTQAKLAMRPASGTTAGVGEIGYTAGSGDVSVGGGDVVLFATPITLTTLGRPVRVAIESAQGLTATTFGGNNITIEITRGGTVIGGVTVTGGAFGNPAISITDFGLAAGTYVYTVKARTGGGTNTVRDVRLVAYEI